VQDGGKTYNVLIYNSDGINQGVKLLGSPGYPTIVEDFASTLKEQATYKPDIWVSSHAGQFNLHQVYKRAIVQSRSFAAIWRPTS
jgi:metallo-beta-lactamase class B